MALWNDILGRSATDDNVTNDDGSDSELDELKMRREGIEYVGTDATGRPMWEDERGQRLYYEDLPKKKGRKKKPNDNSGNNNPPGQGSYGYSGPDYSAYGKKDNGPSVINNPVKNLNNTVTPIKSISIDDEATYNAQLTSNGRVTWVFNHFGDLLGTWDDGKYPVYIADDDYESIEILNDYIDKISQRVLRLKEVARKKLGIYYDLNSFSKFYDKYGQSIVATHIERLNDKNNRIDVPVNILYNVKFESSPYVPKSEVCTSLGLPNRVMTVVSGHVTDHNMMHGPNISRVLNTHPVYRGELTYYIKPETTKRSTYLYDGPNENDSSKFNGQWNHHRYVTVDPERIYLYNDENLIEFNREDFSYVVTRKPTQSLSERLLNK